MVSKGRVLVAVCLASVSLLACQGGSGHPLAPTALQQEGSLSVGASSSGAGALLQTTARPGRVCRGGPGGSPCWAPGERPPTGPQRAAVVNYDESASGDLSGFLPYDFVGVLGPGTNTIRGTTSSVPGAGIDIDSFAFEIPSGSTVTQVVFEWSLVAIGRLSLASTSYELQVDEGPLGPLVTVDLLSDTPPFTEVTEASGTTALFGPSLPVGPGTYNVANSLFATGGPGSDPKGWTANYTWTIVVQ
jgi:hypothetical protein